jgi:hypothetical protein
MMYIAYANDYARSEGEEVLLIAVKLDESILNNLRKIIAALSGLKLPYRAKYKFEFPTDGVRLLESSELAECVKDNTVVPDWAKGGDDPLEYYRFIVGDYEPTDEFAWALKPSSVCLSYGGAHDFGFDVHRNGKMYYGYEFAWEVLK